MKFYLFVFFDNDGCADDPNVLGRLLQKRTDEDLSKKEMRQTIILPNKEDDVTDKVGKAAAKAGYLIGQIEAEDETKPKCSGLKFTKECSDASIEELFHFVTAGGHAVAYPKFFGNTWKSNSTMTQGMDKAR